MTNNRDMANAIRFLSIDAVEKAQSGHPGMPMGMADVATSLFQNQLKFSAKHPHWHSRDRFILSAGHGSMLHYSLLYLTGYTDISLDDIKNFRQFGSKTAGHPEYGHIEGIETTTGPLGQGVATSVGIALSERMLNDRFGDDLYSHYTYVIAGDGCLMEGISQEAISMAGHWKLGKLILLFDDNGISIDGSTDIAVSEDTDARFKSAGWHVVSADAHDTASIDAALTKAKSFGGDKPVMIRCTSVIGFGSPNKAGTEGVHGAALGTDEVAATRKKLNWSHEPFVIPEDILSAWRNIGKSGDSAYDTWKQNFDAASSDVKSKWKQYFEDDSNLTDFLIDYKKTTVATAPTIATRKSSQVFLDELVKTVPNLIGGSADLTHSNLTHAKTMTSVSADNYAGNYIHYGVREHAMGSVLNGLALSGGLKVYGGTFFVFTDFCRPSIRLSALMELPVIYIMTHDSIGLGEDGPTHQPIEHLNSFRVMPNVLMFRPADVLETAECLTLALQQTNRPSVLALSRQVLPCLVNSDIGTNNSAKGAYIVQGESNKRDLTIMATGSEVSLAMEVADKLKAGGLEAVVVSTPSMELFNETDESYQEEVLGNKPVFAIEAGNKSCWYEYVGRHHTRVFGINTFGASAPAPEVYKHFGLELNNITQKITKEMQK